MSTSGVLRGRGYRLDLGRLSRTQWTRLYKGFEEYIQNQPLVGQVDSRGLLNNLVLPLVQHILRLRRNCSFGNRLVIGVNGAQGSGKTTLVSWMQYVLNTAFNLHAVGVSLDDFYLTKASRTLLSKSVHPLLATRGVPGTHDVDWARQLLERSKRGQVPIHFPVFDKALDDRMSVADMPAIKRPIDVLLFEGWCVGAPAQAADALRQPINALEKDEDANGDWRHYVNELLAGSYARLWQCLDGLIMIQVKDFSVVFQHRWQQEQALASRLSGSNRSGQSMDRYSLRRFIDHYQRLTEHQLVVMPDQADIVLPVTPARVYGELKIRNE